MVPFSVSETAGALVEAEGAVLVAGDSLVLELQPAVNAPIPINAAAPATNAMRRVKVTDAMVSPKFEYENVDPDITRDHVNTAGACFGLRRGRR